MKITTQPLYLIVFFFGLFVKANCQINPPEFNHDKFKGQVFSVQQDQYTAVDSFGELKKRSMDVSAFALLDERNNYIEAKGFERDDTIDFKTSYEITENEIVLFVLKYNHAPRKSIWKLDKKGNITEYTDFLYDTIVAKELAKYDLKNNLLEYKSYGKDGSIRWVKTFKYDLKGNQIERVILNNRNYFGHEKLKYDIQNRMIEMLSFDKDEKLLPRTNYKYDRLGNLVEEIYTWIAYDNFSSRIIYQYNNRRKVIGETHFNSLGTVVEQRIYRYDAADRLLFEETNFAKETYTYDASGNLTEEVHIYFGDNKKIESTRIQKYEYDTNGNWVKKIEYSILPPKMFPNEYVITERKIAYRK